MFGPTNPKCEKLKDHHAQAALAVEQADLENESTDKRGLRRAAILNATYPPSPMDQTKAGLNIKD